MYELPTVYGSVFTENVVLPTNMYEMPKIYDNKHNSNPNGDLINGEINKVLVDRKLLKDIDKQLALNVLKDLHSRQELIIRRIESLENKLSSSEKTVKFEKNVKNTQNKSQNEWKSLTTSSSIGCSEDVLNSIKDMVIVSDGKQIPLSVLAFIKLLKNLGLKISIKYHFHSSFGPNSESVLDQLNKSLSLIGLKLNENEVQSRGNNDFILTFIFKNVSTLKMILSPNNLMGIENESNILRFMARFAAILRPELSFLYEGIDDISRLTAVDTYVDEINIKLLVNFDAKYVSDFDSRLSSDTYLCPNSLTIADLFLWSGINQRISKLTPNLQKWSHFITQFVLNSNKTF